MCIEKPYEVDSNGGFTGAKIPEDEVEYRIMIALVNHDIL